MWSDTRREGLRTGSAGGRGWGREAGGRVVCSLGEMKWEVLVYKAEGLGPGAVMRKGLQTDESLVLSGSK